MCNFCTEGIFPKMIIDSYLPMSELKTSSSWELRAPSLLTEKNTTRIRLHLDPVHSLRAKLTCLIGQCASFNVFTDEQLKTCTALRLTERASRQKYTLCQII